MQSLGLYTRPARGITAVPIDPRAVKRGLRLMGKRGEREGRVKIQEGKKREWKRGGGICRTSVKTASYALANNNEHFAVVL